MKRFRVAYIVTHPIQYQAPMLRYLAAQPDLDLKVFFLSDMSIRSFHDPGFGCAVEWDVPLLDGYEHEFLPAFGSTDNPGFWRPLTKSFRHRLAAGGFDAVWVHGYGNQAIIRAVFCAKQLGIPVLMRGESWLQGQERTGFRRQLKEWLMPCLFRNVSAFLAVGSKNAEYYRHYGVGADRIFTMPYAVDNQFFQKKCSEASADADVIRNQCGAASDRPIILFCSKLIKRKNPKILWQAYKKLSQDGISEPKQVLVYVGDGPERAVLQAEVVATGWKSVYFAGFQNQQRLPAWYAACDCMVLPSIHEPWGLVINEAMNAGKAVICTSDAAVSYDLIQPGRNGQIVAPNDIDGLHAALREVVPDRSVAKRYGQFSLEIINAWGFKEDHAGLSAALRHVLEPAATV